MHSHLQHINHPIIETPLLGVGHSCGGNIIFGSSTINPGMFKAMIGIDGIISYPLNVDQHFMLPVNSYKRRDIWPSREEAAQKLRENSFYKTWKPDVFDLYIKYGLRNLPTAKYPDTTDKESVTLTTPSNQEVTTFVPLPNPLSSSAPFILNSPYNCLLSIKNIKTSSHLILADVGREAFPLYKDHLMQNKNFTFNYSDETITHSVPFEDPEFTASAMAKFAGPALKKALNQQQNEDEELRYAGFHPVQHEKFSSVAEKLRSKKPKNEKL